MCSIFFISLKDTLQGILPCPNLVWLPFLHGACFISPLNHSLSLSTGGFSIYCIHNFLFLIFFLLFW